MIRKIQIDNRQYMVSSDDTYLNAVGRNFEPNMVQLFRNLIEPSDIVADVGANIGLTSLLFSSLAKKTYAFEPSPSTFNILTENLGRNEITNVVAINQGLGERLEDLTITFASNNRSGGFVSSKTRPDAGHTTEEIEINTLDHYFFAQQEAPTFLKIDVEGFEHKVVLGGLELLEKSKPIVVLEMNHFCLNVLQKITIPDFLDFMRKVFPYLYAIEADNSEVVDLHIPDKAYMVMHEHVVHHRFPNLVGGFSPQVGVKLDRLKPKKSLIPISSLISKFIKTTSRLRS